MRLPAGRAQRVDPEGSKSPEGEWRRQARLVRVGGDPATGLRQRNCRGWGKPAVVAEPKGGPGREETDSGLKQQAGNIDPVLDPLISHFQAESLKVR